MCPGSWTNKEGFRDYYEVECDKKSILKLVFEGSSSDIPNDDVLIVIFKKKWKLS